MMDKRAGALAVVILIATAGDVLAECVDLNEASLERLTAIVHINEERADQVIAGRPWPGVRALTQVHGIGRGRIREQDLACVGVRVPAGVTTRKCFDCPVHMNNPGTHEVSMDCFFRSGRRPVTGVADQM